MILRPGGRAVLYIVWDIAAEAQAAIGGESGAIVGVALNGNGAAAAILAAKYGVGDGGRGRGADAQGGGRAVFAKSDYIIILKEYAREGAGARQVDGGAAIGPAHRNIVQVHRAARVDEVSAAPQFAIQRRVVDRQGTAFGDIEEIFILVAPRDGVAVAVYGDCRLFQDIEV